MPSYGAAAADTRPEDADPVRELRDSADLINDREALDATYEREGYLFFRGLLPPKAVSEARGRMAAPLIARGLAVQSGEDLLWTGGDAASLDEYDGEFGGTCQALFDTPGVRPIFEKLLGESVSLVPLVQYRAYPPGGARGRIHQDGFFSPGISGYRPIWIPLVPMDRDVGGLAIAVGMTGRGYFHNTDKTNSPIPAGIIPASAWATTDYRPGDVLVIHPETPHVGLPNHSEKVRLSFDTRVQSAARPSVILGSLVDFDEQRIVLRRDDGVVETLEIDDETFIRTGESPGRRLSRAEFASATRRGLQVIAARADGKAHMLRRSAAG